MKKYLYKLMCIPIITCVMFAGCSRQPEVYNSVDTAMGTIISQTIYISSDSGLTDVNNDESLSQAEQGISKEILSCIDTLEKDYLSWRLDTSEIYRINESAGSGQSIELSSKLSIILEQCQNVYAASDGAFDFTIGSLARLWDIDAWAAEQLGTLQQDVQQTEYLPPAQEEIASVMENSHADLIFLEGHEIKLPEGMQLDLGAVGKGIVLDEVKDILNQHEEVTGAVISAGGSILTYGCKPDGSSWNIAIVDPFDTTKRLGLLKLSGQWCVSTSGDYERYVEVDGRRYHHILDPVTGYPADNGVKSVTILTDRGLFSDALSTACFVLGVEKGLELAESFQTEAIFVDAQGEIYMTAGMEQYFVKQ